MRGSTRVVAAGVVIGAAVGVSGPVTPAGAQVGVGGDGSRVQVSGYRAGGEVHVDYGVSGPIASSVTCRELVGETAGMIDADVNAWTKTGTFPR